MTDRIAYDEFSFFAENAAEAGLDFPRPPDVRRESVALPTGRQVSALVWGAGPPEVVLLHGGGQNAHTWDTVLLALDRSAVAIDLPDHGHSDVGADDVPLLEGYAADVAEAIRQLAPAAGGVVGMSAGGLTAIDLTWVAPTLVPRLMLVDVLPEPDPVAAAAITDFLDGPDAFDNFDEILERTTRFNPTRSRASLRRGILHNARQLPDGRWQWRHRRNRRRPIRPADPGDALAQADRLWARLGALTIPVTLVRGQAAGSVVTDAHVARLHTELPAATVVDVAGAGHSVQGDQPVRLAEIIGAFLR